MPNWCSTQISIKDTKEELNKLYCLISEWISKNYRDSDWDLNWLGNIVGNSGLYKLNKDRDFDVFARGKITDFGIIDNALVINEESAWRPAIKMWLEIIDKFLLNASLEYVAEECGCELCQTNMEEYANKYYVDIWENEFTDPDSPTFICDHSEIFSEEGLISICQKLLNTDFESIWAEKDINKLIARVYDNYPEGISIHKIEYVNEYEQE